MYDFHVFSSNTPSSARSGKFKISQVDLNVRFVFLIISLALFFYNNPFFKRKELTFTGEELVMIELRNDMHMVMKNVLTTSGSILSPLILPEVLTSVFFLIFFRSMV
jgi:hypothetical protein